MEHLIRAKTFFVLKRKDFANAFIMPPQITTAKNLKDVPFKQNGSLQLMLGTRFGLIIK